VGIPYHLVYAHMLKSAVELVYPPRASQQPRELVGAKVFIFAFTAFCTDAGHRGEMLYPFDSERCALEVKHLLPIIYKTLVNLQALQTILLLVCFPALFLA
jgi:hypothetical protein